MKQVSSLATGVPMALPSQAPIYLIYEALRSINVWMLCSVRRYHIPRQLPILILTAVEFPRQLNPPIFVTSILPQIAENQLTHYSSMASILLDPVTNIPSLNSFSSLATSSKLFAALILDSNIFFSSSVSRVENSFSRLEVDGPRSNVRDLMPMI